MQDDIPTQYTPTLYTRTSRVGDRLSCVTIPHEALSTLPTGRKVLIRYNDTNYALTLPQENWRPGDFRWFESDNTLGAELRFRPHDLAVSVQSVLLSFIVSLWRERNNNAAPR